MRSLVVLLCVFLGARTPSRQFTPALLQNNSYWGDGKAEFNIYDAQIARYGIPRPCEVLHILVREPFDPKQFVKPEGPPRPETIAVLKLNQILMCRPAFTFTSRCTRTSGGWTTPSS